MKTASLVVNELVPPSHIEQLSSYADRHELFEIFEGMVSMLVKERPPDVISFLIDNLSKPKLPAIVIFSPPYANEDQLCLEVAKHHGAVHINSVHVLSKAIERQTNLGAQAKPFMEKGQLVPDTIVLALLQSRLQEQDVLGNGYVLQGFPKTKEQALMMQAKRILPLHFVHIEIPDDQIIEQTTANRFDPLTSKMYNYKFNPPPEEIESRLIHKVQHSESTIRSRLEIFRKHQQGVLSVFKKNTRKFTFKDGLFNHEKEALSGVLTHLEMKKVNFIPRCFKVIIAGLPGSGKSSVAQLMEKKYGYVHVSPLSIILEEVENDTELGAELEKYVDTPDDAPEEILIDLIANRLRMTEAVNKGWILEGYPKTESQAAKLKDKQIIPNRVIWLSTDVDTCISRLSKRRWDNETGRKVHLENIPTDFDNQDIERLAMDKKDEMSIVEERIKKKYNLKAELSKVYGFRTDENSLGILQEVEAKGVGEGDGFGNNPTLNNVVELVEGVLLRSISKTIDH